MNTEGPLAGNVSAGIQDAVPFPPRVTAPTPDHEAAEPEVHELPVILEEHDLATLLFR